MAPQIQVYMGCLFQPWMGMLTLDLAYGMEETQGSQLLTWFLQGFRSSWIWGLDWFQQVKDLKVNKKVKRLECGSVGGHLPSMEELLRSFPIPHRKKEE